MCVNDNVSVGVKSCRFIGYQLSSFKVLQWFFFFVFLFLNACDYSHASITPLIAVSFPRSQIITDITSSCSLFIFPLKLSGLMRSYFIMEICETWFNKHKIFSISPSSIICIWASLLVIVIHRFTSSSFLFLYPVSLTVFIHSICFIHRATQLLPTIEYWQIPIIDFCFRAYSPLTGFLFAAPAPCSPPPPFSLLQCGIFQAQWVLQCWGSKRWCKKEDEKEGGRKNTVRNRLQYKQ